MTVARPNHPDLGGAHWAFGAPVAAADSTSILVPASCLQWPRRAADAEEPIWEAMRFWLDETVPPPGEGVLDAAFAAAEAPARTRLREAFEGLALCDRQLSRRIRREHGVSFRDLRGDALVDLARDLLRNTDETIEDIGARLGYAEERSFRRFIRGRRGLTPAQIRWGGAPAADPDLRVMIRSMAHKLQV
jgi:AraC-like DNA-binding protein